MKVLLLTRYGDQGASSRVRFLQYLGDFQEHGWSVVVSPLLSNSYLQTLYKGRVSLLQPMQGYIRRLYILLWTHKFDVVIIEKELFPFLPALFERCLAYFGVPYLVDYDDALFHRYDLHKCAGVRRLLGGKIDTVMRKASVVMVGNEYLADRAKDAGAQRVEIIPTVVDTERYQPVSMRSDGSLIVGWIGTPKTSRYLLPLLPVFEKLRNEHIRFVAVGVGEHEFAGTPVEAWPWSEETEVSSIQRFDIGIMPLEDSPWERGKCGYKLIQYMACGVPVVASPVGVNIEIVDHDNNGLLADGLTDWEQALRHMLRMQSSERRHMGANGRNKIEMWYSRHVQAARIIQFVHEAAR